MRQNIADFLYLNFLGRTSQKKHPVALYSTLTFLFRPAGDSEGVGGQAGLDLQDVAVLYQQEVTHGTLGLLKWTTEPSSLIMLTSSIPGMLDTGVRDVRRRSPMSRSYQESHR